MSKQQTALDFFISELESKGNSFENGMIGRVQISINVQDYQKLKDQAKQMGKEQMKEAALDNVTTNEKLRKIFEIQFEDFYNETYGGTQ
jgi:hypothetical protein